MKTKCIVGKIEVEHDNPQGELPWAVVAAMIGKSGQSDLAYFKTRKLARECAKRLRAALRGTVVKTRP